MSDRTRSPGRSREAEPSAARQRPLGCRRLGALLLAAPLVGAAAPIAEAQAYRWVDDSGRTHYGDRPPADADAARVETPPDGRDGPAPAPRVDRGRLLEAIEFERRARAEAARERREQAAAGKARCAELRDLHTQYERANLIYREDESGEREYLDDEERAAVLERLRAKARKWCR